MTITTRRKAAGWAALALVGALAAPLALAQSGLPKVQLATSLGTIVLELDEAKAPKTVANFLQYVRDKHYDGTIFHRVIDGFMIQGGGFDASMQQKATRAPIVLEVDNGLTNTLGTVAMARTANPDSATAQFFINLVDNPSLDGPRPRGYAVFGRVVQGMEVVNKIRAASTGNRAGHQNVPLEPVYIKSASIL